MNTEPQILPLWRDLLKCLRKEGLTFGAHFAIKWMEEKLDCPVDDIRFGAAICKINDQIVDEGFYLSRRGTKGEFYYVVPEEEAPERLDAGRRQINRLAAKQVAYSAGILANPAARLKPETRKRLEHAQEKDAVRLALLSRRNPQKLLNP